MECIKPQLSWRNTELSERKEKVALKELKKNCTEVIKVAPPNHYFFIEFKPWTSSCPQQDICHPRRKLGANMHLLQIWPIDKACKSLHLNAIRVSYNIFTIRVFTLWCLWNMLFFLYKNVIGTDIMFWQDTSCLQIVTISLLTTKIPSPCICPWWLSLLRRYYDLHQTQSQLLFPSSLLGLMWQDRLCQNSSVHH